MKIFLSVLIAAIVVVVTIVGGCCLMMAHPHVRVTPQPLSLNEYRTQFGHEEFPSTASNIWYAISSVGLGGRAQIYRFDAPTVECRTYAQRLIAETNSPSTGGMIPAQLEALTASPQAVDHAFLRRAYGLKNTAWFDVDAIRAGWEGRGPPSGLALVWIDAERGRFYYYWTD